jgi:protein gp37
MYRAGIWDGKWMGKDGKTGKRDVGSKDGKVGRDIGLFSRFPVHFPFFFKPWSGCQKKGATRDSHHHTTYPSMPLGLAGLRELIRRRRRPTILFQF